MNMPHAVAERYGVWGLKKFMGREHMGVLRTTFIIDQQGRISRVFEGVRPDGHSSEAEREGRCSSRLEARLCVNIWFSPSAERTARALWAVSPRL
ncbi:MAG: hypothetical protein HY784_00850 [Chloroflexi bacterium]|nr:hypothetical protein [Chloroflexota bacterium]